MRVSSLHVYPVKGCRGVEISSATVDPWGLRGDRRWLVVDDDGRFQTQREHPALARVVVSPASSAGSSPGLPVTAAPTEGALELVTDGMSPLVVEEPQGGRFTEIRVWDDSPFRAVEAAPEAHKWFSEVLGSPVRLVWLDDPLRRPLHPRTRTPVTFADRYPLLVTTVGSLSALNDWVTAKGIDPLPMSRFRPNIVVADTDAWAEDGWAGLWGPGVGLWTTKQCGRCVVTTIDQQSGRRPHREPLTILGERRRFGTDLVFGINMAPRQPGTIAVGEWFTPAVAE